MKLQNYAAGTWVEGSDDGRELTSAVDGRTIAAISSSGIDFAAMLDHARKTGGPNLRKLTFHERALMLKELAIFLTEHKKEFYSLSTETGATLVAAVYPRSSTQGWPRAKLVDQGFGYGVAWH